MKNSGNTVLFRKLQNDKANLKAMLGMPALTITHRVALKVMINAIDDATLGTQTKINHAREIYGEMKTHKTYADDAEKTKQLLTETQNIITEAQNTAIVFDYPKEKLSIKNELNLQLSKVSDGSSDVALGWVAVFSEIEGDYVC